MVVLRDVGAIHRCKRPPMPTALHPAQHVDWRRARECLCQLRPCLIHPAAPCVGQNHGVFSGRSDAHARPSVVHQPAQSINRFVHVPDWRGLFFAVRPFVQQRVLLLRWCVNNVWRDCPCRRVVKPLVAPCVIFRPVRRLTAPPLRECTVIKHHGLAYVMHPAHVIRRSVRHTETPASQFVECGHRGNRGAVVVQGHGGVTLSAMSGKYGLRTLSQASAMSSTTYISGSDSRSSHALQ